MKRWMKFRGMALALALLLAAGTPLYVTQTPVEVSAKTVKKGLKKEKGNYYYYDKGVKVKKKWITIGKKKFFFKNDGTAAIGWNKIGGKAYYFTSKAVMVKNKKVDKVKLNAKGQASLNNARVKLIFEVQAAMARITKKSQSKEKKLKACYEDVVSYSYLAKGNPAGTSAWEVSYAYDMLDTGRGNCYSYAAAFGMLARGCGYDAKIVTGKMSKDGADPQPHAWVEINGKVYDTQSQNVMGIDLYGKKYSEISRISYTIEKKI